MGKSGYSEVPMGEPKDRTDLDRLTDGQEGREIIIVATWLRKSFFYNLDAVFYQAPNFCTKFDTLNDFFNRRASYHFKA